MNTIRRHMEAATVIVLALMLATAQSAVAHAGHAHASDDGLNMTTMLSVAGVIVSLGIAWRMTSRLSGSQELPGDDTDPTIG